MKKTLLRVLVSSLTLVLVLLPAATQAQDSGKIDLNTATAGELASLPGVGKILAGRIVTFRQENGPFDRVEDLLNVQGIGEKNFLRIRERVTVGDSGRETSGRR